MQTRTVTISMEPQSEVATSDHEGSQVSEQQGITTGELLRPRGVVTEAELALMPASLKPSEALPWARISRSAFYAALRSGEIGSCRLGRSIRIPTRRFLRHLGVLDDLRCEG
jgi:hypothetical protein